MYSLLIALVFLTALGLGALAAIMTLRAAELNKTLEGTKRDNEAFQTKLYGTTGQVHALEVQEQELTAKLQGMSLKLEQVQSDDFQKTGWLDAQQQELGWLRKELEKRPRVTRKTYKILTLGVKWTGKTSLTLKWANPLVDLGAVQGTKIERYERTVSQVVQKDLTTEHVFEIGDWGGEHIVDAQQELIVDEIHGLLIVVDLGGKDANAVEPARIQDQLREFQPESLKFFFNPKMVASCKAVALFINKSDLLSGTPAEIEVQAKHLYGRLIEALMRYQTHVDIRVFVGSASSGHSTHLLFSHFVERILPKNAYDNQLLQRMKTEAPALVRTPPRLLPPAHNGAANRAA